MDQQRFQKLLPVGKLYSQGKEYFLLKSEPEIMPSHNFVDGLGCWEFMVVPNETISITLDNQPLKSNGNIVHPSPRLIVVTDFLIEWGSDSHILAMPTEYEAVNV